MVCLGQAVLLRHCRGLALRAPHSFKLLAHNLVTQSQRLRKVLANGGTRKEFMSASCHAGASRHLKVEKAPDILRRGRIT